MTSQFPPAAVPGPDDVPEWEQDAPHQQPDPFGDPSDNEGATEGTEDDEQQQRRNDPRAQ